MRVTKRNGQLNETIFSPITDFPALALSDFRTLAKKVGGRNETRSQS